MSLKTETLVMVGAVAVVTLGAAWALKSAGGEGGAGAIGAAAGAAVVDAAAGAATGAVVAVGQAVGIPATNQDQCSIDLAAGDLWAASFSCPASRFIKEGVFK